MYYIFIPYHYRYTDILYITWSRGVRPTSLFLKRLYDFHIENDRKIKGARHTFFRFRFRPSFRPAKRTCHSHVHQGTSVVRVASFNFYPCPRPVETLVPAPADWTVPRKTRLWSRKRCTNARLQPSAPWISAQLWHEGLPCAVLAACRNAPSNPWSAKPNDQLWEMSLACTGFYKLIHQWSTVPMVPNCSKLFQKNLTV